MITLDLLGSAAAEGWEHQLAGDRLWCDIRLPGSAGTPVARPAGSARVPANGPRSEVVYDGPGEIGGRLQRVRCELAASGVRRIEIEDGDSFLVSPGGDHVERLAGKSAPTVDERVIETALGAPLVLALALRNTFVLHASALRGARGVVALTAATGGGKSTLAAAASAYPEVGWSRVADDQLPVRFGGRPLALPHFPQLKLGAADAYPPAASPTLPLLGVVEVERLPATAECSLEIERLPPAAACLALGRATVATRLFDRALLARHLDAVVAASETLWVARLRAPDGLERLRAALMALAERLGVQARRR